MLNFKNPLQVLKNQRGIALLVAMACISLVTYIAIEVSYDTNSEYVIAAQQVNQMKAYYAAKSGVEISLLRIQVYQKVKEQLAGNSQAQGMVPQQLLDLIWKVPFAWPPVIPDEVNRVDKESIQEVVSTSLMDASYLATIESENSKIDLLDLVSPSKTLAEGTKKTLIRLIQNRLELEDSFAQNNRNLNAEELVNNIIDWMDPGDDSLNGGSERALYSHLGSDVELPPNQPFRTLNELHMVSGMKDEIFDYLEPNITIYGAKGIQVNSASKEILMSLSPSINEQVADEIKKHIDDTQNGGPFKDLGEFENFLNGQGVNLGNKDDLPPLIFDAEYNFRIRSNGIAGRATSEIVAIVYDFDKVKGRLSTSLQGQGSGSTTSPNTTGSTSPNQNPNSPSKPPANNNNNNNNNNNQGKKKTKPQIVYWYVK